MVWIMGPGHHPLRVILQAHIHDLSRRKWGVPDLTWIVTKGGSTESMGSPPWQNICRAWSALKPLLRRTEPRNLEEWRQLPLWRPHTHHMAETCVFCRSQAQHRLRDAGLLTVGDITGEDGQFKTWASLPINHEDQNGLRAFDALVANIRPVPHFEHQMGPHRLYFGEESSESNGVLWLYNVQQQRVSSEWRVIRDSSLPISTFRSREGVIRKITRSCPPHNAQLHRVLVRHTRSSLTRRTHFGLWSMDKHFLLQYKWSDGSLILDTTTAQLRTLQASRRHKPHSAATRWAAELGCETPGEIWRETWLNYRAANENTFLWQLYYRAIATQRWRFPSLPVADPQILCTRCDLGEKEDVLHCVWGCPQSQPCWTWGLGLLTASCECRNRIGGLRGSLEPKHIFLASPLPVEWRIPNRIWHLLRAIISWQVWKTQNEHYMANRRSDPHRTIRKSWHRLSMYIRKEWAYLKVKIRNGRISLAKAEHIMQLQFGTNQEIWALHDMVIQVPPVPPRPP